MNVIDLLVKLQLPVWVTLSLAVIGAILFQYYRHRLGRSEKERIARLTSQYEKEKLQLTSQYEKEKLQLTSQYEKEKLQLTSQHDIERLQLASQYDIEKLEFTNQYDKEKLQITSQYDIEKLELTNQYDKEKLELINQYERGKLQYEKSINLLQDRLRARLEALDSISFSLAEFDHAIDHIRKGNSHYEQRLQEFYKQAREAARKHEGLLGTEYTEAVKRQTEAGSSITAATFTVTSETIEALKQRDVPEFVLQYLEAKIGQTVPVLQAASIVDGLNEQLLSRYRYDIIRECSVSEEYDYDGYEKATRHIRELKQKILATLPNIEI